MTRSIFDPTGPDTEHSGDRNLGPDADNISHMPPEVTDGKVSEEESEDLERLAGAAHPGTEALEQTVPSGSTEQSSNPGTEPVPPGQ